MVAASKLKMSKSQESSFSMVWAIRGGMSFNDRGVIRLLGMWWGSVNKGTDKRGRLETCCSLPLDELQRNNSHPYVLLYVNLRFVEKMYSFPDNLRKPSCDQERKKVSGTEVASVKHISVQFGVGSASTMSVKKLQIPSNLFRQRSHLDALGFAVWQKQFLHQI